MSKPKPAPQRVFVPASQLVWDDERLGALSKEQLTNLMANLRTQLAIGRITEETAEDVERRIRLRLPAPAAARRKRAAPAPDEGASAEDKGHAAEK